MPESKDNKGPTCPKAEDITARISDDCSYKDKIPGEHREDWFKRVTRNRIWLALEQATACGEYSGIHKNKYALDMLEEFMEVLRPFSIAVFNDNGDVTVSSGHISTEDYFKAYRLYHKLQTGQRKLENGE